MRAIWILLFLQTALSSEFGTSYLKNSRLCQQWSCLNTKLGLQDTLPSREQYTPILISLLPNSWHGVVGNILDVCYGNRPRRYTNTCPGQALMNCVVDQMIENCPDANWVKEDACAPLSTLAGFKYMFTQSRYINLEQNLASERRPSWFLKNYFNVKCCNLPELFNSTVLNECGFNSIIHYYLHQSQPVKPAPVPPVAVTANRERLRVVNLPEIKQTKDNNNGDSLHIVDLSTLGNGDAQDPLECCDMTKFIPPSWRSECDFHLTWEQESRLRIVELTLTTAAPTSTTTQAPVKYMDVKVVPLTCEQENCVFKKLNIVSDSGAVDIEAFSKLLDNVTNTHTEWTKAKARVVTKCLTKPITDYTADCDINKVLACTFDVLSENCPYAPKFQPCKHNNNKNTKNEMTCQISSSKYRPKHRRQFCGLPSLVNPEVLTECGLRFLSRMEYSEPATTVKPKHRWFSNHMCKDLTTSTACLANKMGVLNKYGFLDYFKMKDNIRNFSEDETEWQAFSNVYNSAFTSSPLYEEHCNSQRKMLNVIDTMLMTCPISKRKNSPHCDKIFYELANTLPGKNNTKEKVDQILKQYNNMFLSNLASKTVIPKVSKSKVVKNPMFNFGILQSKNTPPVKIINVPVKTYTKPLVLYPVYQIKYNKMNTTVRPYDGILRSGLIPDPNSITVTEKSDFVKP